MPERGTSRPIRSIASLKSWRSSPFAMAWALAPINLHAVPRERAVAIQLHGGVQRGLAAHRRQNRVRFFAFENRFDHLRGDRLDVGAIGELRIGHDRGRIRVHEHDLVAFLAQRLAGLHAGIIKFAALPDDDRTGADQQDFVELIVPRHCAAGDYAKTGDKSARDSTGIRASDRSDSAVGSAVDSRQRVDRPSDQATCCAALPVEVNFADALDPREHVIGRLAAHPDELGADDAGDEIARQIENFLRRGAIQPLQRIEVMARVRVCTSGPSVMRMCALPSSSTCR